MAWHCSGPFFSPRAVLVGLDDGRIDHAVLIVHILRQGLKGAPPDIRVALARVAKMHHPKVAKACG